ncbi:hypothetical protein J6590_107358, partial [Homalodisca vitripennis]
GELRMNKKRLCTPTPPYLTLNLHQQQNPSRETAERAANHALLPLKPHISVHTPKIDN